MIDFDPSEEQQMIRDTLEAFAREQIRPVAREADDSGVIPADLIRKTWDLGLVRGALPLAQGGYGEERSAVTGAIVAEALAYGDLGIALHALAPRLVAFPVLEMGSGAQRRQLLPGFAGETYKPAAAALIEPQYDFDPGAMRTRARPLDGGYVLNGDKCLVPLADEADTILVYAALGEDPPTAAAFLVPSGTPGITIGEREKYMGIRALATFPVHLRDCRVGRSALLGEGASFNFARLLTRSRIAVAALGVGIARAAFEYARDYAKERRTFGAPIASRQAIAFMLADMAIEIDAARLLVWEAAALLDRTDEGAKEAYLAHNYVAAAALKIADNAVQILGGHGYIRAHPVELWLRNARGLGTFVGLATV